MKPIRDKICHEDKRRKHLYLHIIHGFPIVERTWGVEGKALYIVRDKNVRYLADEKRIYRFD